jgi:CoA-dependent NAD(P)H sulfur oxidoreductase
MTTRLIAIGGVAAGMSAAAKAKRTNRDLEVIVYERSGHISYAACGMPYLIAGDIPSADALIQRTPAQMARQGVQVYIRHEVTAIDPQSKSLTVRDLELGRAFQKDYDKLVIATGALPAVPDLPGWDAARAGAPPLAGVLGLRTLESGLAVQEYIAEHKPRRAVVLGGGYIGVEMAETLRRLGLEVTMVIRSGQVLRSSLDDDLREVVHAELAGHGVEVMAGTPVAFEGRDRIEAMTTAERSLACDLILLGLGARPNVGLAEAAGVHLGLTGAIATDEQMRTNLPGVYAAGDCTEVLHRVTDQPAYIPLGSTANKQGRVAGTHAGGGEARFGGVVGTMTVRCFDLAVSSTGLTAAEARRLGYEIEETSIKAKDISHYYPGASDMHVRLVIEAGTGRLLGGQIVGSRGVAKRIDTLATALHNHMTIEDLQQLDLAYAPPFAPAWDPILVAANVAAK